MQLIKIIDLIEDKGILNLVCKICVGSGKGVILDMFLSIRYTSFKFSVRNSCVNYSNFYKTKINLNISEPCLVCSTQYCNFS